MNYKEPKRTSDKEPKCAPKRSRVAKGEDFQVQHLAETTDLSPNQARELLRRSALRIEDEKPRHGPFQSSHEAEFRRTSCALDVMNVRPLQDHPRGTPL